jgi:plasmid stabilization system protein ParE
VRESWTSSNGSTSRVRESLCTNSSGISAQSSMSSDFRPTDPGGLRRILLRATRYHVYYVSNAETVLILAVWSAVRGAGPDLKRLLH